MTSNLISTTSKDNINTDNQHDLLYWDYGTGIKLSSNSTLKITQLNLNLKDETATIYAMNLKDYEVIKLYDYQPYQDISYTPVSTGIYKIIARLSTGDIIDLTSDAFVETSLIEENNSFKFLDYLY